MKKNGYWNRIYFGCIRNSKVTKCETKEIELKILKAEPTTVLIVKSSLITSPKNITSVDEYKEVLDNC